MKMKSPLKCTSLRPRSSNLGLHSEDIIAAADRIQHRLMGGLDTSSAVLEKNPSETKGHNFNTCEVLGPTSCTQCLEKQFKRDHVPLGSHSAPDLLQHMSANFSQVIKLKKLFPELTHHQLQQKINCGEVNHTDVRSQLSRLARKNELQHTTEISRLNIRNESNSLFFSTIHDLRNKIAKGTIPRTRNPATKDTSLLERLFPSFCSTKDLHQVMNESDGSLSGYSPPLLPVHMQQPEPQFFAGQTSLIPYELPERAPMNEEYLRAIESSQSSRRTRENTSTSLLLAKDI